MRLSGPALQNGFWAGKSTVALIIIFAAGVDKFYHCYPDLPNDTDT